MQAVLRMHFAESETCGCRAYKQQKAKAESALYARWSNRIDALAGWQ